MSLREDHEPAAYTLRAIPYAKPAFELIDGLLMQKVSPRRFHSLVHAKSIQVLQNWADSLEGASVNSELDVDFVEDAQRHRLVPDIAVYAPGRLTDYEEQNNVCVVTPPSAAFEVASPDDPWRWRVRRKGELYLAAGTALVSLDPDERTVELEAGSAVRILRGADVLRLDALPGFEATVDAFFSTLPRRSS